MFSDLKSNMDRFIEEEIEIHIFFLYLKSNMDRFIDTSNIQEKLILYI